jgi:hypothetical protein
VNTVARGILLQGQDVLDKLGKGIKAGKVLLPQGFD